MTNRPRWVTTGLIVVVLALLAIMVRQVNHGNTLLLSQPPAIQVSADPQKSTPGAAPSNAASSATMFGASTPSDPLPNPFAAFVEFSAWTERFLGAPTADAKSELLAEGRRLALARREVLAKTIPLNPK